MNDKERDIRKNKIALMASLYYKRVPLLQKEPLESFIDKNIKEYLDSTLSIEEINDSIGEKISKLDQEKDDLDEMLKEEVVEEKGLEKKKVLNEEGNITSMIITTLALMSFSLCCIGLIVIYLLKI